MAKTPPDAQPDGPVKSTTSFNEVRAAVAERNERAHREAQELRAAREKEKLGIVSRHRLDLDR